MKTIVAFFFLIAAVWFTPRVSPASENANTFWNCPSGGGEISFRLRSSFYLHEASFRDSERALGAAALKDAIVQHLRFAQGHFVNQASSSGRVVMKMSTDPTIESIRVQKSSYPFALEVDAIDHPDVKITHPYLLSALKTRTIAKGDAGLKVSFSARLTAMYCGSKTIPTHLDIDLPSEPYLAYWLVPTRDRREIHWHLSNFKINPCADSEYADIPDPYYYWYFWKPQATGLDAKDRPFQCKTWFRENHEFVSAKVSDIVVDKAPARFGFSGRWPASLRIAAIFGVVDPKGFIFDYRAALAKIAARKTTTLQDVVSLFARPATDRPLDPGSDNVTTFVRELPTLIFSKSASITADADNGILTIESHLAKSAKSVRIEIYFGQTDVLTVAEPSYWRAVSSALAHDDVVLYAGHSGLGENLKLTNVLAAAKLDGEALLRDAPARQILGFFSCYSYSYFGDEIAQARARASKSTDVIRTASAFTSAQGHVAVLRALDEIDERHPATSSDLTFGPDALVVMSHRGEL